MVIEPRDASRSSSRAAAGNPLASWVDAWQPEDAAVQAARQRAQEVGVGAVTPAAGAALRMLAVLADARSAVEIGTGTGVSTLWLLNGLRPDGVLTSIDAEPEHHRLARLALAEAGVPSGRVRLIGGRALDVLPRLSDGAYDVVLCDAAREEDSDHLAAALRLLRPGGLVVFAGLLAGGRLADSSARDSETVAARDLCRTILEEPRLVPAMLPVGTGLLAAVVVDAPE